MSFVRYMHSNTFSSAVASFSSLNDTCWWKLNCINLNNIWCINVHNLQVFVLFKKVFVFQRHKDILLCFFPKFLFLYLLHLDLQSIWSSFCLWNEVGMIFPHQEYPGHLIPFIAKDHTYPTALQYPFCHKSIDHRSVVLWILFFSKVHLHTLKPIPHCHNHCNYITDLDSVFHCSEIYIFLN